MHTASVLSVLHGSDGASPMAVGSVCCLQRSSACPVQAQELTASATLQVDFRHVESFDAELAGLIQQHHYRVELGLRQVTCCLHVCILELITLPSEREEYSKLAGIAFDVHESAWGCYRSV